jgi:hypothetical protein
MTTAKDMRRYYEPDLLRMFDGMQIEAIHGRVGDQLKQDATGLRFMHACEAEPAEQQYRQQKANEDAVLAEWLELKRINDQGAAEIRKETFRRRRDAALERMGPFLDNFGPSGQWGNPIPPPPEAQHRARQEASQAAAEAEATWRAKKPTPSFEAFAAKRRRK